MPAVAPPPRRALVLAGGGTKAAFTAGVLEVLLPTLGEDGDHKAFVRVEAASSGVFNAAMMAAGRSPGQIGDNWRKLRPLRALSVNWPQLPLLSKGRSLLTWNRFMRHVVTSPRGWGLFRSAGAWQPDGCDYHFNAYNFSDQRLVSFDAAQLDKDRFLACIALPRWFPPVKLDGKVHVDAVFTTDSNADAVLDVADLEEIWVIWTVDVRGRWHNGYVSNYFRLLEQSAAGAYGRERKRILDAGFVPANEATPQHRKILYEIAGDVPAHYLLTLFRRTVRNAVKQGTNDATEYLQKYKHLWSR